MLIGLVLGGLVVVVVIGVAVSRDRSERRWQRENPDAHLDQIFNGEDVVSINVGPLSTLTHAQVVVGAESRGYALFHQGGADQYGLQELVFRKAAA